MESDCDDCQIYDDGDTCNDCGRTGMLVPCCGSPGCEFCDGTGEALGVVDPGWETMLDEQIDG